MQGRRPYLITFSGLDGSGKSTQIAALSEHLRAQGLRVEQMAFWDDVVVLTRLREGFVHRVYHSELGIGAPERPVNRRDKNMRGWKMTLGRCLLYLLDAVHTRLVVRRRAGCDVLILDRYLFDELANLPLRNWAGRMVIRALALVAPRPDLAILLDTDPVAARRRKPEYPLDFMHQCRGWYFRLGRLLGGFTIISPAPVEEAAKEVMVALRHALPELAGDRRQEREAA